MIRSAGVLMSVTSLPSPYGIGTLGKSARDFVDFLAEGGQTYWQILPLGPTGFGNSPYQALSSFAGNPYLIDLDDLIEEGLLTKDDVAKIKWFKKETAVDYGIQYKHRYKILRKAADKLPAKHPQEYLQFLEKEKGWLKDYAVFMAIKDDQEGKSWLQWPVELRIHGSEAVRQAAEKLHNEVCFYERMQYLFFKQMTDLKKYANARGVQIMGDLPFYVAADSIDVWAHPEQFEMNDKSEMTFVSGMAPDGGHPKGQKWGNPLFNWDHMRNTGYDWWISRMEFQCRFCDAMRIDHFQGYDSYFAVPAKDPDASNGHFRKGPGLDLFRKCEERIGKRDIIVEDLGILTDDFKRMVKESGYPGMKILEYAFDPNDPGSVYMPFQYDKNSVVYTGTHDNDTLVGWKNDPDNKDRVQRAKHYLCLNNTEGFTWGMLRAAYGSVSELAIIPMQDLLGLGTEARMNDPHGSIPPWTWRCTKEAFDPKLAKKLKEKMLLYCRNNWNIKPKAN